MPQVVPSWRQASTTSEVRWNSIVDNVVVADSPLNIWLLPSLFWKMTWICIANELPFSKGQNPRGQGPGARLVSDSWHDKWKGLRGGYHHGGWRCFNNGKVKLWLSYTAVLSSQAACCTIQYAVWKKRLVRGHEWSNNIIFKNRLWPSRDGEIERANKPGTLYWTFLCLETARIFLDLYSPYNQSWSSL